VAYRLQFLPEALKEWEAIDGSIKAPLQAALKKRLENLHVPSAVLGSELAGCYKIKLRKQGYRLVYVVENEVLVVIVLAISKRERLAAYESALKGLMTKRVLGTLGATAPVTFKTTFRLTDEEFLQA
jgi:mRNA interferase RelE/StbE